MALFDKLGNVFNFLLDKMTLLSACDGTEHNLHIRVTDEH